MISTYNQLCPVIFGPDAALETGKKVKELNGRNVMCIFDKGVESSGIADKIMKKLRADPML